MATMEDRLNAKQDEYQKLKLQLSEQESSKINLHHDLQTLLASYNQLTAENEQLHSETKALYQQLQEEQMKHFVQQTKDLRLSGNMEDGSNTQMIGGLSSMKIQSLVKRGKLLT